MTFEEYWNGKPEKLNGKLDIKQFAMEIWEDCLNRIPMNETEKPMKTESGETILGPGFCLADIEYQEMLKERSWNKMSETEKMPEVKRHKIFTDEYGRSCLEYWLENDSHVCSDNDVDVLESFCTKQAEKIKELENVIKDEVRRRKNISKKYEKLEEEKREAIEAITIAINKLSWASPNMEAAYYCLSDFLSIQEKG